MSEALAYQLGINLQIVIQERQQLRLGYGAYAALRGVAYLGRGSLNRIADDYQRGRHGRNSRPITAAGSTS